MIRIGGNFYYKDSSKSREKKSSEKIKTLNKIKRFNRVNPIKQKEDYQFQKALEDRPARLKRSCKKMGFDKILEKTLKYISETESSCIHKEDLARDLRVKEHEIEKVFHKLNLDGVLHQRVPYYAHDTNRNPIFPGSESGWASDIYYIRDKKKAGELFDIEA